VLLRDGDKMATDIAPRRRQKGDFFSERLPIDRQQQIFWS